jgi:hypothetical protein
MTGILIDMTIVESRKLLTLLVLKLSKALLLILRLRVLKLCKLFFAILLLLIRVV